MPPKLRPFTMRFHMVPVVLRGTQYAITGKLFLGGSRSVERHQYLSRYKAFLIESHSHQAQWTEIASIHRQSEAHWYKGSQPQSFLAFLGDVLQPLQYLLAHHRKAFLCIS